MPNKREWRDYVGCMVELQKAPESFGDRALKQRELNKSYTKGFQGHWKTLVNNKRKNTGEKALQYIVGKS